MLTVGEVLNGSYEIVERIGEGGGGIVYKARHLRLDTDVVVKQIREEVQNKIYRRQEADILKQLKHPYLPRVYDFVETDEGIFTVMDFIEGRSLEDILKRTERIPQRSIIKWGTQLADALAYLHKQTPAIIHSDIKPANIIITPQGDATLIDFNVSVLFDDTEKYSVGISLGYAPPEQYRDLQTYQRVTHIQAERDSDTERVFSLLTNHMDLQAIQERFEKTVYFMEDDESTVFLEDDAEQTVHLKKTMSIDARSDVYSLGCVLYHMATGKAPDLNFDKIQPLLSSDVQLSEALKLIIDKMMELTPSNRYQNGGELFHAFSNIVTLDHRYIALRRKEKMVLVSAVVTALIGGSLLGVGIHRVEVEKNAEYESQIVLADGYAYNMEYDSAIEITNSLQLDLPERLKAYEREAYYLYMAGRYEEAQSFIEDVFAKQLVVENRYNQPETIGNLYEIVGNCAYELEDYGNALNYIEKALEWVDDNPSYYRDYAICLAKTGDYDGANVALDHANQYGLDETSASYVRAEIESSKGNYDLAIKLLEPLIATNSDPELYHRALYLAGRDYYALERYEDALRVYQEMYDSGLQTYQISENIAYLYYELGDIETSEELLLGMASKYPNNYRVYKRLAILEVYKQELVPNEHRDYSAMKSYYDKAVELYEQSNVNDSEMVVLKNQMQNVIDGGWF